MAELIEDFKLFQGNDQSDPRDPRMGGEADLALDFAMQEDFRHGGADIIASIGAMAQMY